MVFPKSSCCQRIECSSGSIDMEYPAVATASPKNWMQPEDLIRAPRSERVGNPGQYHPGTWVHEPRHADPGVDRPSPQYNADRSEDWPGDWDHGDVAWEVANRAESIHEDGREVGNDWDCASQQKNASGDVAKENHTRGRPMVLVPTLGGQSPFRRSPNVSRLCCGRIQKSRRSRWRRASPRYITTGDGQDTSGSNEARPSSTAC